MKKLHPILTGYRLISILLPPAITEILLLFYLKYNLNGLSLSNFSISNTGNLLNIYLSIFLIAGIFVFYLYGDSKKSEKKFLVILSVAYLFPLLLILLITKTGFKFPEYYIYYYSLRKFTIGILFLFGKICQTFTIFYLWSKVLPFGKNKFLRSSVYTIIFLSALGFYALITNVTYKDDTSVLKFTGKNDIAVVLGAAVWNKNQPSPIFKGRIDKALELHTNHDVKNIQLTGGSAPGEMTESEAALNYLDKEGISTTTIFYETETTTTSEQIKFIKTNLLAKKMYDRILIITDHFHLRRVMEICQFFHVDAYGISSEYKLNWEKLIYYRMRDSVGLILFWFFAI